MLTQFELTQFEGPTKLGALKFTFQRGCALNN